jgi:hypothetical protein
MTGGIPEGAEMHAALARIEIRGPAEAPFAEIPTPEAVAFVAELA